MVVGSEDESFPHHPPLRLVVVDRRRVWVEARGALLSYRSIFDEDRRSLPPLTIEVLTPSLTRSPFRIGRFLPPPRSNPPSHPDPIRSGTRESPPHPRLWLKSEERKKKSHSKRFQRNPQRNFILFLLPSHRPRFSQPLLPQPSPFLVPPL
ncbi:hypothetical protein IE53DRAFT_249791 [Violaceomyces palustris]|uniref:Uncharacterized protein n=1 Tax=Violaceomyces palustris TaxID=1673888 RepID=A0ACD0NNT3_9BASI|nr:hypothetical protein IE53DRAFT_249791 [Violaceomyces palustris]